jgi:hypothetical protein
VSRAAAVITGLSVTEPVGPRSRRTAVGDPATLMIAVARGRMPEHRGHMAGFLAQGVGCLLPLTTSGHGGPATASVVAFVLLLGLGFGLPALLRGMLLV